MSPGAARGCLVRAVPSVQPGDRTTGPATTGSATSNYWSTPPRRGTRFRAGDQADLIGPYEELLAVLRRDRPAPQVGPAAP
jgi:hypothetical protein